MSQLELFKARIEIVYKGDYIGGDDLFTLPAGSFTKVALACAGLKLVCIARPDGACCFTSCAAATLKKGEPIPVRASGGVGTSSSMARAKAIAEIRANPGPYRDMWMAHENCGGGLGRIKKNVSDRAWEDFLERMTRQFE